MKKFFLLLVFGWFSLQSSLLATQVDEFTDLLLRFDGDALDSSGKNQVVGTNTVPRSSPPDGNTPPLTSNPDDVVVGSGAAGALNQGSRGDAFFYNFGSVTFPYTVDFYIKFNSYDGFTNVFGMHDNILFKLLGESGSILGGKRFGVMALSGNSGSAGFVSSQTAQLDVWHHIAVVMRSKTTGSLFVDGQEEEFAMSSGVGGGSWANNLGTNSMSFGNYDTTGNYGMKGFLDEVRVSKGIERFTQSFDTQQLVAEPVPEMNTFVLLVLSLLLVGVRVKTS